MKKYISLTALLMIIFVAGSGSGAVKFTLPEVKKVKLNNGLTFLHVEDELPQTTIIVSVGFGRMYEDEKTAGISDLIVRQMLAGGSVRYPGTSAFEMIENRGGSLSISTSWEATTVSVQVLSKFTEEAFDVVSSFLESPAFTPEAYKKAAEGVTGDLKMRYNDPFNIGFDFARNTVFRGAGYGALPTVAKTGLYNIEDLKAVWKKYFTAGNMIAAVSSSESYDACRLLAEKSFRTLSPGKRMPAAPLSGTLDADLKKESGIIYLVVRDIPQATVIAATAAPGMESEASYTLTLMDYLLGGGSFSSKLMSEIRVKRGLAYMVQSVYRPRGGAGIFMAIAQTKTESTGEVLGIIQSSIDEFSSGIIPADEIRRAKEAITNSYIFRFDSRYNLLSNYINMEYYGLAPDYYEKYTDKMNAVTAAMIASETSSVTVGRLVRVVVGSKDCLPLLEKLGKVEVIEKGFFDAR
jgi:predicted Zn-dependent peptidase